jgi:hypothetical protein
VRIAAAIIGLLIVSLGGGQVPGDSSPSQALPPRDQFMARVRAALRIDPELQQGFTYLERRREVKFSALGKVSVGPLRTFEVFPAADPARTYKRLIAVDGKPLDAEELRKRDAEHARDIEEQARRDQRESPDQRARRLEQIEDDRRERQAILTDALAVFDAALVGRESVHGEPTIIVTLTPKPDARVSTRQGNWMKHFQGRAHFVERDAQFAGFDMAAIDEVSIGWGIIGRLHKGSRLIVERRPVDGLWLPARLSFAASGKTLMFRPFTLDVVAEYFDYRKK